MSSAARSADAPTIVPNSPRAAVLSGPVAVCVDRPLLSLDRAFTYQLPGELGAQVGSLVRVPLPPKNQQAEAPLGSRRFDPDACGAGAEVV